MATGKRAGARRASRKALRFRRDVAAPLALMILCLAAWGFGVMAAIDFGAAARAGKSLAWAFLALSSLAAASFLFAALMLGVRALRRLGVIGDNEDPELPHELHSPGHRRAP